MKTNKEITTIYCGSRITIPEGSEVLHIDGNGGGFVLASTSQLVALTGNTHDPKYRYCWVDSNDVDGRV